MYKRQLFRVAVLKVSFHGTTYAIVIMLNTVVKFTLLHIPVVPKSACDKHLFNVIYKRCDENVCEITNVSDVRLKLFLLLSADMFV